VAGRVLSQPLHLLCWRLYCCLYWCLFCPCAVACSGALSGVASYGVVVVVLVLIVLFAGADAGAGANGMLPLQPSRPRGAWRTCSGGGGDGGVLLSGQRTGEPLRRMGSVRGRKRM